MKKAFIFGLIAAALGFTACSSEDDLNINDNNQKKGMVLRATVEQTVGTRATFTDAEGEEGVWQFAFAVGDNVSVTNIDMPYDFYTFTNEGTEFKCEGAKAAESEITWYAYFPSNEVSLVGQSGTKADVANKYALAGKTASATTGEEGLNITMSPKVAILVINNQIGEIDINVKNGASTWVKGLTANADGFNVTTSTTQQNLLSATTTGTYYIAVPAGVQLAVKDGDKVIKSTGTSGLTAGKYYYLPIFPFGQGEAEATGIGKVKWIQLWENGPKFAEYNVGVTDGNAESYGGYYCWGSSYDESEGWKGEFLNVEDYTLTGEYDTATNLWGNNWRMPTEAEYKALLENCKVKKEDLGGGKSGFRINGNGVYTSNSIILPNAGYYDNGELRDTGWSFYWSSTQKTSYEIVGASYWNGNNCVVTNWYRNCGYSVRAVLNETK